MDAFLIRVPSVQEVAEMDAQRAIRDARSGALRQVGLGEAWAGLHFVMTGEYPIPRYEAEKRGIRWSNAPLENALMGGVSTTHQGSYGPTRYLSPELVGGIAKELESLDLATFDARFDADELEEEEIPPGGWEDVEQRNWLRGQFEQLRKFYQQAANAKDGVLIHLI